MKSGKKLEDIKIEVLSGIHETTHDHAEPELLYVIEGDCICTVGQKQYTMQQQDIVLFNSSEPHSVTIAHNALACRIWIPCEHLDGWQNEEYFQFRCNSLTDTGYKYTELRKDIILILLDHVESSHKQIYGKLGRYYLLLDRLMTDFSERGSLSDKDAEWEENRKLLRVMQYIHANIGEKISLSEIAEALYMSPSTLSRFFHKKTGQLFNQYVKNIRLQKVAEELKITEVSATRLAVEFGFSSPSSMSAEFKAGFGMTPMEYRRQCRTVMEKQKREQDEKHDRLIQILEAEKEQMSEHAESVSICVDTSLDRPYKMWRNCIANIGPAYILETASMRSHVLLLKEQLDIEYVRIWSLFSERLVMRGKKGDEMNFIKLDEIFDFCVENHLKLFLDLASRTNTALASENRAIYSMEEGIEFESQADWENCLDKFCRHIVWRYGKEITGTWIFEFSFFLNAKPYFVSDVYSPRKVWNSGRRIIKKNIPDAKVAGPGLRMAMDKELVNRILQNFMEAESMPDIFTSYNFPYEAEDGQVYRSLPNIQFLGKQIELLNALLKRHGFEGSYYITDWNNSLANRNYIQDSCYRGTYILKNVLDYYDNVDEMGFWYMSDILNVYYDTEGILSGSAGILTKDGIRKPAYYAFRFLSDLGSRLIEKGENYIITKNEENGIRILCFNNKNLSPKYFLVEEDRHKPEEVSQLFLNKDSLNLKIRLENLPYDGTIAVRQKIVNEEHGSILNQWIAMGCERELLPEDIRYLRQTSVPAVEMERIRVEGGHMELHIRLMPHEMRWISMIPV